MSESINHNGIIEKIEDGIVYVRILQRSACSGCHAQSMCAASESKEKTIEVPDRSGIYQVDEEVQLCGKSSLGLQAVFLAFVLPLIIIFAAIAIGTALRWEEAICGLTGIMLIVPYYFILYILHDKLKKRFVFNLKKLN